MFWYNHGFSGTTIQTILIFGITLWGILYCDVILGLGPSRPLDSSISLEGWYHIMQRWPDPDWPIREQEHQVSGWGDLPAAPVLRVG